MCGKGGRIQDTVAQVCSHDHVGVLEGEVPEHAEFLGILKSLH